MSLSTSGDKVDAFGALSGYKVNRSKSEAIPLRVKGIQHLGINIQTPIDRIFDVNSPQLLETIREDLKSWTVLPISFGAKSYKKENIFPRLSFLISVVPLQFPPHWFKEINKLLMSFLWKDKSPIISNKKWLRPRTSGGLGVPDVYSYLLAYNARFPCHGTI